MVRTWGRETNRSGQLPALEADGGRERRAIGDRSSGGPPSPAPRRGTFFPLVGCTGRRARYRFARWSAVRAAAGSGTPRPAGGVGGLGALIGAMPLRCRGMRQVRIRSRIRSMCRLFPQAGAAVSPASLSLNTRAGSAVDVGYKKANHESDVLRELSRRTTCSKRTRSLRASRPPKGWARTPCPTCACRTLRAGHLP